MQQPVVVAGQLGDAGVSRGEVVEIRLHVQVQALLRGPELRSVCERRGAGRPNRQAPGSKRSSRLRSWPPQLPLASAARAARPSGPAVLVEPVRSLVAPGRARSVLPSPPAGRDCTGAGGCLGPDHIRISRVERKFLTPRRLAPGPCLDADALHLSSPRPVTCVLGLYGRAAASVQRPPRDVVPGSGEISASSPQEHRSSADRCWAPPWSAGGVRGYLPVSCRASGETMAI